MIKLNFDIDVNLWSNCSILYEFQFTNIEVKNVKRLKQLILLILRVINKHKKVLLSNYKCEILQMR